MVDCIVSTIRISIPIQLGSVLLDLAPIKRSITISTSKATHKALSASNLIQWSVEGFTIILDPLSRSKAGIHSIQRRCLCQWLLALSISLSLSSIVIITIMDNLDLVNFDCLVLSCWCCLYPCSIRFTVDRESRTLTDNASILNIRYHTKNAIFRNQASPRPAYLTFFTNKVN
jgi:hypothetical protein